MPGPRIAFCNSGGTAYSLDTSVPINFGNVLGGTPSANTQIYIKNYEAANGIDLIATEVMAVLHPFQLQAGTAAETYNAVTFASTTGGNFLPGPYYVGTVYANTATTNFYAKWTPPSTATKGHKIWALMVTGNYE